MTNQINATLKAIAANNGKWPSQLSSGVMFYEGQKVLIEDFKYYAEIIAKPASTAKCPRCGSTNVAVMPELDCRNCGYFESL